ncbi:MAG TPA: redoxin domain-containing protein [Gallionella sp.]|nr:redoxin domain-containing protein [Gallionella sp.]
MLMTINQRSQLLVAGLWVLMIAAALTSVRAKADDQMPDPISANAQWLNSPPLNSDDLRGKVVLVEFWTYDCVNCLRTLPYVKAWSAKYRQDGLLVVGVHTPEFGYEKDKDNVERAVRALGITYPVVMDNTYEIWNAYQNTYWPAQYLMDAQGRQRYQHFGEGAYQETERMIRILLAETHQGASSARQ